MRETTCSSALVKLKSSSLIAQMLVQVLIFATISLKRFDKKDSLILKKLPFQGTLAAEVKGPNGAIIPVDVYSEGRGIFVVSFTPRQQGNLKLITYIKWDIIAYL